MKEGGERESTNTLVEPQTQVQCYIFCMMWLVNFALLSSFDVRLCFSFLRSLSNAIDLCNCFLVVFLVLSLPNSSIFHFMLFCCFYNNHRVSLCVSLLILFMRHSTLIFTAAFSHCAICYLIAPSYSGNTLFFLSFSHLFSSCYPPSIRSSFTVQS